MDFEDLKLTKEQIEESLEQFEAVLVSMNKMRQNAMYVDIDWKIGEVTSPLLMNEKELKGVSEATRLILKTVKLAMKETSEEYKEKLRRFYASFPEEAWETGELPIQWLID
jgi:hypothetical protein